MICRCSKHSILMQPKYGDQHNRPFIINSSYIIVPDNNVLTKMYNITEIVNAAKRLILLGVFKVFNYGFPEIENFVQLWSHGAKIQKSNFEPEVRF